MDSPPTCCHHQLERHPQQQTAMDLHSGSGESHEPRGPLPPHSRNHSTGLAQALLLFSFGSSLEPWKVQKSAKILSQHLSQAVMTNMCCTWTRLQTAFHALPHNVHSLEVFMLLSQDTCTLSRARAARTPELLNT